MSFWNTLFVQLVFVIVLETTCSNHEMILRSVPKVPAARTYADLLNSLIKVNVDRVEALKKLYRLNSVPYGKDALRTTIENSMLEYDELQEMLIMAVTHCLNNVKFTPKSINEDFINKILYNEDNAYNEQNEIYNQPDNAPSKKALRNEVSNNSDDDNNSNENNNDSQNDSRESKSISSEKMNENALDDNGNNTQGRSYYVYGCGRGRLRCFLACKAAYRYACIFHYCSEGLRNTLRSSCKSDCKTYFY